MPSLKIKILTLFPEFFSSPLQVSLIGKAKEKNILEISTFNLRDYSNLKHSQVDDTPYGGGDGMVMRADILAKAVKNLQTKESLVILLDPAGKKLDQKIAWELSKKKELILVCGRYEGVDQRFKDKYVDMEISIGDYVINGGEAASLVLIEAVGRLVEGVIGKQTSALDESFSEKKGDTLLEYPQYTRPEEFEGLEVPEVLKSGNHKKIEEWRLQKAREKTKKLRPDLLED